LRDDLGHEGDATKENYDITYSRGIPKVEYIVNLHMHGPKPKTVVVPVNVVVSVKNSAENKANPKDRNRPEATQSAANGVSLQDGKFSRSNQRQCQHFSLALPDDTTAMSTGGKTARIP
jgi:hypothetical protein